MVAEPITAGDSLITPFCSISTRAGSSAPVRRAAANGLPQPRSIMAAEPIVADQSTVRLFSNAGEQIRRLLAPPSSQIWPSTPKQLCPSHLHEPAAVIQMG
ncbi:hypothetical protein ACLOJK_008078 [Asimina triloba]